MRHYCFLTVFVCLAATSSGAQTHDPEAPVSLAGVVHFGDLLDVDVVGNFEFDWRGTITPEGYLDGLDTLENQIYALCRSESEIAEDIRREYAKFLREPKVVVRIIDRSNRATAVLQGAVKMEQRFQLKRPIFLNELLIIAGGLSEGASGEIVVFRPPAASCAAATKPTEGSGQFVQARQNNGAQTLKFTISDLLSGSKDANPQIFSGDIITIVEASPIYVIGGVNDPRQISTRSEITLSRAIATAGGPSKDALEDKVTVYRRENGSTTMIEANLTAIEADPSKDVILKPYDIVDVGQKGRAKRRFAPVIKMGSLGLGKAGRMPLRVID